MAVDEIRRICVVGAGTMGYQIALQCAVHNYDVHLWSRTSATLVRAGKNIRKVLEGRVNRGKIPLDFMQKTLSRITYVSDIEEAARDADFVIETVCENVKVKRQVFSKLDSICPPHTIIASNTSSIKPSILAEVTKRPEKVLAMNFENPVWESPIVEVMGAVKTSEETIKVAKKLVRSIALTPIIIKKEIMGYALNRIWRAIKKEALHLADNGYASFEDIDRAFIIEWGTPNGPFMIMDRIGLDVVLAIEEQYYRESGHESDKPPKILVQKVKKGDLGIKTGKGFYQYPNPSFKRHGRLKGELDP